MNKAARFIRVNGIEKAKKRVELDKITGRLLSDHELELKRLVESWGLIEKYRINKENINWMLSKLNSNARHRIMQAWADVESCQ